MFTYLVQIIVIFCPWYRHRLKTLRNGIGNAIHCNAVSRKYDVIHVFVVTGAVRMDSLKKSKTTDLYGCNW